MAVSCPTDGPETPYENTSPRATVNTRLNAVLLTCPSCRGRVLGGRWFCNGEVNTWGLTKPDAVGEMDYLVHSPRWGMGFQKMAHERAVTCYVKFPDHPAEKYADIWEFLVEELGAGSQAKAVPHKVSP